MSGASGFRVALIRPEYEGPPQEPCEPLGCALLVAALTRAGFAARVFDRQLLSDEEFWGGVAAFAPSMAAFSLMSHENVRDSLRVLWRLRRQNPDLHVAAGGLYVTTCLPAARAQFPSGAHLLTGEGEVPLVRLCQALSGAEMEPDRVLEPDEWPFADRTDLGRYVARGAAVSVRSSRGCAGHCSFCATPNLPAPYSRWAARSIANLCDELGRIKAVPVFSFVDDDFGPLSRVEALAEELERRSMRIAFSLQLRASSLYARDDLADALPALRRAGLCRVFVGLESLSPGTLARFDKPLDPERALNALKTCDRADIETHVGYILWHPWSTMESVLSEAEALHKAGFFTIKTALSRLVLFPKSRLHAEAIGPNERQVRYAPVNDEGYFERLAAAAQPLFDAWVTGATALPRLKCLAHLNGEARDVAAAGRVRAILDELSETAFQLLHDPAAVREDWVKGQANQAGEELYALGCAGQRRV